MNGAIKNGKKQNEQINTSASRMTSNMTTNEMNDWLDFIPVPFLTHNRFMKKKSVFLSLIWHLVVSWMPDVDIVTHMRVLVSLSHLHAFYVCVPSFFSHFQFQMRQINRIGIALTKTIFAHDVTHFEAFASQQSRKKWQFNGIFAYAICAHSLTGIKRLSRFSRAHISISLVLTKEMH